MSNNVTLINGSMGYRAIAMSVTQLNEFGLHINKECLFECVKIYIDNYVYNRFCDDPMIAISCYNSGQ